jgi:hypothetical protein
MPFMDGARHCVVESDIEIVYGVEPRWPMTLRVLLSTPEVTLFMQSSGPFGLGSTYEDRFFGLIVNRLVLQRFCGVGGGGELGQVG